MKDTIITCPKTKGDLCYVNDITEDIKTYFSLSCGFWTNSLMKEGEEFYNEQIETLPELYKELAWTDPETNLVWLPTTMNEPTKGMIFANGTNSSDWKWAAVKAVVLSEEESKNYPMPGKKDQFYTTRMDMTTMQLFDERDFIDAMSYINLIP